VKDLEDMTAEEIREWDRRQREESHRGFAGQPEPRVSRGKRREYQDFYGVPRAFRVAPGLLTSIVKQPSGETTHGRVRGLREVADGGPNVVLLELAPGVVWAVRRADKSGPWDPDPETFAVVVEHATVPVEAWPVDPGSLDDATTTVAAPDHPESWTVRTASLGVD
jgi:hypothetical protein